MKDKENSLSSKSVQQTKNTTDFWYGSEPEIAESKISKTITTEILICGAGTGGMVAAIASAKKGVKTLVIEKNSSVGCFKTYVGAIDSKAQKNVGNKAKVNKEELIEEILKYPAQYDIEEKYYKNSNPVKEELVRLWADESGEAMDFLAEELSTYGIKHVAEYDIADGFHGNFKLYPIHTKFLVPLSKGGPKAVAHSGMGVIEQWLTKKAKSYGADFMFNTSMIKLIKEGEKVVGVIAKGKDEKYIKIIATKGVLLTTGGYADDQLLFSKLNPQATSVTTYSYVQKGNHGDGIKAGIWAGGVKDPYPSSMLFDRGIAKPGAKSGIPFRKGGKLLGPVEAFHFGSQPFMKVNMDGKRYYNETVPYDAILYPLEFEKNGVMCIIWDSNYWKNIEKFHTIGCSRQLPSTCEPKTYEGMGKTMSSALIFYHRLRGYVKKARTIEKLAKKLKLPPEQLKATVERYNKMAKAGVDEDFGKPSKDLIALEKAPYYGATNAAWVLTTMDGLDINANMQVLDKNGQVIEGLYAAGDVAGGFFGNNYYPELFVGLACGKTVTFARHAILEMTK